MKKSIKILFSLLLICTIMLPFGVRAATDYSINTSPIQTGTTCVNPNGCAGQGSYTWNFPSTTTKGVRITITDENGDKLAGSKTVDFIEDNLYTFAKPVYYNKNKTYKKDSYNGSGFFSSVGALKDTGHNNSKFVGTYINSYFDLSLSSSLTCGSKLDWSCVRTYLVDLASNESNLIEFLKKFNVTYDNDKAKNWYFIVEPIVTMQYTSDGNNVVAWVVGTMTELENDLKKKKSPINEANNNYGHIGKTIMSYSKSTFSGNNLSSTFKWNAGSKNVGLIWLGVNANPPTPCSKYADDTSIWVAGWKYDPDKANDKVASNPNNNTIRSTCGLAPTPCHKYADDTSIWTDGWKYAAKNAYLNVPHGSDKDEIRKKCGSAPKPCSDYKDKNTTIWIDGWVYDSNKASTKIAADAANDNTIRKTCGYQITCETDDIYNKSTDFTDVQLTSNTSRNCCKVLEGKYANDKNKLNELYRDHNECYECKYYPTKIKPTCSTGDNKKTTGYTFTRDVGNATVTADTYTCISWAVDGKDKNVSKNLFTKKDINKYCKVICSETVTLEFPFFNNGNSVRYVTKNSIFAWPKKNNSDEDELKLKASGKLTCWYRVNLVGLYNEFGRDKNGAVEFFNQCKDDMNKSLTTPENILPNSYNLSGSFKVKTDDDPNYVSLAKENRTNSVSYTKQTSSAEITLSATKDNVSSLVRTAEKLKFEVTENANFIVSNTGKDAGYSYSYDGKYYRSKTDVGISNIKSNNIIKFEPSLKFNEKTGSGNVSIIYSNIGGSSPKFIENEQTYENKDGSGLKNNRCVYKKINNGKEYLCPDGTKNRGMNLKNYMTTESLTYDEAVEKYCNESNNMTVCPSDSYYSNKAITKTCYNDETCLKLTCYRYTCTDDDGCHELNDCIEKTIKDYNMTFEDAKKICTNKYCDGKPGNIEYRVIDLKEPFPGNEAKSGFPLFNSTIKGRKPGSNWNSTTIVQKEILNNRGVKGDAVYNLTPLYEFNLTPSVIKEIREYNDNHSYDDFTLSCKGNNKQACVASGFDFKTKFGIVKVIEQCKGISNLAKFNSCYNNNSLR